MTEEIWKPITGYEDLYEVSNLGRVKSLARRVWRQGSTRAGHYMMMKEKIMTPSVAKNQQQRLINFSDEFGNRQGFLVSRLVAQEFIPNLNNYNCVIHKGDKLDDSVYNLRWGTKQEAVGPSVAKRNVRLRTKRIRCIETGIIYNGLADVKSRLGMPIYGIKFTCNGTQEMSRGYHWEYVV